MVVVQSGIPAERYGEILGGYIRTRGEEALYEVSLLSQTFIESGLGPEDIVALHFEALEEVLSGYPAREMSRALGDAHQFLLEVMIAYGVKYREYLELRVRESIRDAEARAEIERQRALDAERAGLVKGEILGVIAHELRTPITAAMGNVDLARRSLSRGQVERVPGLLGIAREALDRLSRLSGDLVEASRGEAPALDQVELDLCQVATQACRWVEAAAAVKDVSLNFQNDASPIFVRANADGLLSVLGNLLSNAIRYTPAGGQVAVRYGVAGDWAWVEVSDTGIGMTPEVRERIFDRFYRAPQARRIEARGLGLGLALVQQIVKAHGGRVEVESVEGQGSAFRVLLPCSNRGDGSFHD